MGPPPCGAIAQLGERLNGIQEVSGSIRLAPPHPKAGLRFSGFFILVALSLPIVMACPNVADEDGTIPSHNTTQNDAGTLSSDDSGATDPGNPFLNDGGLSSDATDAGFTLPSPCTPDNTRSTEVESSEALQPEDGGAPILCVDATVKIKESSLREIRFEHLTVIHGDLVLYKNHLAETISSLIYNRLRCYTGVMFKRPSLP